MVKLWTNSYMHCQSDLRVFDSIGAWTLLTRFISWWFMANLLNTEPRIWISKAHIFRADKTQSGWGICVGSAHFPSKSVQFTLGSFTVSFRTELFHALRSFNRKSIQSLTSGFILSSRTGGERRCWSVMDAGVYDNVWIILTENRWRVETGTIICHNLCANQVVCMKLCASGVVVCPTQALLDGLCKCNIYRWQN